MRCICATDSSIFMPGENSQCENHGIYPIPGELADYLKEGKVCRLHFKYLIKNGPLWVLEFKKAGVDAGEDILKLQTTYKIRGPLSELSG